MVSKPLFTGDFDQPNRDDWLQNIKTVLGDQTYDDIMCTHTADGIAVDPLPDPDQASFVGLRPGARGWKSCPSYVRGDISVVNGAILRDLRGGVDAIHIHIDATGHGDGVRVGGMDDMAALLDGVLLDYIPVSIQAGAEYAAAAADLLGVYKQRDIQTSHARIFLNADPLSAGAPADGLATLVQSVHAALPSIRALGVDVTKYHDAGASEVQELAFAIASGIYYLHAMDAVGMSPEETDGQLVFRMSADQDVMLNIAKFRALRSLWSGVMSSCGIAEPSMLLHGETSGRMMTNVDMRANILRTTAASFAAAVGGADHITIKPYDYAGFVDQNERRRARRTARNTSAILLEESHLGRVADPAGGSWSLEKLTHDLIHAAWTLVQTIERDGGMATFIGAGRTEELIAPVRAARNARITSGDRVVVGVNAFTENEV